MSDSVTSPESQATENPGTAQVQTPPSEAPAVADKPQPTTPHQRNAIQQFLAKEKALREKEQALESRQREVESRYKVIEDLTRPETRAHALQRLGIDPKQLAETAKDPDPIDPIRSELQELKASLAELREREKKAQEDGYWGEEEVRVRESVSKGDFPGINAVGGSNAVYQMMRSRLESTGEYPSEQDAARDVEKGLRELYEKLSAVYSGGETGPAPEPPTISTRLGAQVTSRTNPTPSIDDITGQAMKDRMVAAMRGLKR